LIQKMASASNTSSRPQHTAEEMLEFVTGKIKNMPFVEVEHKLVEKNGNKWYTIKAVNNNLGRIGNGIFYSMTLNTISSDNRIVNIRILFNDSNKELNTEMQANADALIEIFHEVAKPREDSKFTNPTIENIAIKEFEDPRKNKHLAVFANTIRGASLVYTYNLCVNFVREVSSRYGCDATTPSRQGRGKAAMNSDSIEKKKQQLQQQLAELELQQATAVAAASSDAPAASSDARAASSDAPAGRAASSDAPTGRAASSDAPAGRAASSDAPAGRAASSDAPTGRAASDAPANKAATSKSKVPKQYNVQVGNGRRIKIRTPSPQVGAASAANVAPAADTKDTTQ
jgi:hypothetical protein